MSNQLSVTTSKVLVVTAGHGYEMMDGCTVLEEKRHVTNDTDDDDDDTCDCEYDPYIIYILYKH